MSWAVEEWKDGLPGKALQKIQEMECQLEKLKKERQQRQLQYESLEAAFQKEKQKAEKEKNEATAIKRENQSLIESCANLEKAKEKIAHDHQLKETQVNFLDGQVHASKKQIERMEQDLKRYQSELEKSQQILLAKDLPPVGTPQKIFVTPFTPTKCHSDVKFEELQEKYNWEVEERKRLETELKSLQTKKANTSFSQNPMSHREIARNQTASSVFAWQQEQPPSCPVASSPLTPLKRGYSAAHFPWDNEGTPSKQIFRREKNDSCSESSQAYDSIKMQNQELRSKVNDLELRLQTHEKDLKNNLNKLQETQLQLEKVNLELADKDKALNKSRDELLRTVTQYEQAAAKCTTMEQKLKKLSEELSCQRQNAESARCCLEQKMKENEKEYQAELLRQQHSQQTLEQECNQVKLRLTQELQQAKNNYNSLQADLDKELKKEGNLISSQFDQKSRGAAQLEEELKTTKQLLKQSQLLAEDLTNKNIAQEARLSAAQQVFHKQDDPLSLEHLKETIVNLEKQCNSVQDLLKKRDLEVEELQNKLIKIEEHSQGLQNLLGEKEKECKELNKEKLCLSELKVEKEKLTSQLKFEKDDLSNKADVLELSLRAQRELITSLEMEKVTLCQEIQNLDKMVENKCAELELEKQAFAELQQKAEYADQKHRKEEENLSMKIFQFSRQIDEMQSPTLKDQLSALEVSVQSEKKLNFELQQQVGELLKYKSEIEKRLSETEKTHLFVHDANADMKKLQEDAATHQPFTESILASLVDKEKQLMTLLKELEVKETNMRSLQNNNQLLVETMEQMNALPWFVGNESLSECIGLNKNEEEGYAEKSGIREAIKEHLNCEESDLVKANLYFVNCLQERAKSMCELIERYRNEKCTLLERCEQAKQEIMLLQKNASLMEEKSIHLEALLNEKTSNLLQTKLDSELTDKTLIDLCEEYITKCASLQKDNIDLQKKLETLQPLLDQTQAEVIHIQSMCAKEIDCLRQEADSCKAERIKMQEEHAHLFQQNQQLLEMINAQSEQLKKRDLDCKCYTGAKQVTEPAKERDCELSKIQDEFQRLQMDISHQVNYCEQVCTLEGSLLPQKLKLEDSELENTMKYQDLQVIGIKLESDKGQPVMVPKSEHCGSTDDKLHENLIVSKFKEVFSNSMADYTVIGQDGLTPRGGDLGSKINTLESCCETYVTSLKGMEAQSYACESTTYKDLHELRRVMESSRIELESLRKQYVCEKEKWQQMLKNLTSEMEAKLAAEKQQTECLALQLETARMELQFLDLSARSILCTDTEETSQINFRPEYNGISQQSSCEAAQESDPASQKVTNEVISSSATLNLEIPVKLEKWNASLGKNTESSDCKSEIITNPKLPASADHLLGYQRTIDQLQVQLQQSTSENLMLHNDIENNKTRVDSLQNEIKQLYSRLDGHQMELMPEKSTELEKTSLQFEHENKGFVERLSLLSSENQHLSSSVMDISNNLASMTLQLEMYKVQLSDAKEMLSKSERAREDWNEKYLQTENELKRTKSEKANIENHTLALEADFEELHAKNLNLQNESEHKLKLISSLQEQLAAITAERNNLHQELCSLTEGNEELDQVHHKLKEKVKELELWKIDNTEFIKILEAEVKTHKALQSSQSGENVSMESHNVTEQSENNAHVNTLHMEELHNQVKGLSAEKEMLLKVLENLNNKLGELEFENAKLSKSFECALTEKIEIVSRLNLTEGEVAQMQNSMEALKKCVELGASEKLHLVEKLKAGELMSDSLQDKVESVQRESEMLEENFENVIINAEACKDELNNLKTLNRDLVEKLKNLDLECNALREENEKLSVELKKVNEIISEYKSSPLSILGKHDKEKGHVLEESQSLVSLLQTQLKSLHEELLEKDKFREEFEKLAERQTSQHEELQNQVEQLVVEREVLIKASENLLLKLNESESENSRLSKSLHCLRTEKGEIVSQLYSTQEEVTQMRSGIEKLKIHIESDEKKKKHLVEKLKQKEKEADSLNDKILSLQKDLNMLEASPNNITVQFESPKEAENMQVLKEDGSEHAEHFDLNTLQSENEELSKELKQTLIQLSEFEASHLKFAEIFEKHEQEKVKLVEESHAFVSSLQTQLKDLQEEVSQKESIVHLHHELQRNAEIQRLQNEDLQGHVGQLNEENVKLLRASEILNAKLTESESELSNLNKALECALSEKSELERRFNSAQEESTRMQHLLDDMKVQMESNEREAQGMIENLKQSEWKADSLQDKIDSLERNALMSEEQLEDMIIQVESSKEEAENLKALNEGLSKKQKELDCELHTIQAKNMCLIEELQLAQEHISDLEASHLNTEKVIEQYEKEKIKMQEESQFSLSSLQSEMEDLKKKLVERDNQVPLEQEFEGKVAMQILMIEELQNQARQLLEEKELIVQTANALQTSLSASQSEISRLSSAVECFVIEKASIESKLSSSCEDVALMQREIEALRLQIGSSESENQAMSQKLKLSERKVDSLQDKIESLERNMLMSDEHLEDMIIQVETSKEEAEHFKMLNEDMMKKQAELNFELNTLTSKNDFLDKELQQTREQLSHYEASQSNLSTVLEQYEQEKVRMLEESNSVLSSMEAQLKDLDKLKEERDHLVNLTKEYKTNAEITIMQLEELRHNSRQMNEEKELLLQTSETLKTKLSKSEAEIERLSNDMQCMVTAKGEIELRLVSSNDEVASMRSDTEVLKLKISSMEMENLDMIGKLNQRELEVDSLHKKIESLERNVLMSEGNLEDLIIQVESSKEEAENLKAQNQHLIKKQEELTTEIDAERTKHEGSNKELQLTQEKVAELQASQSNLLDMLEQHKLEQGKMLNESKSLSIELNKQKTERDNLLLLQEEYEKKAEMQMVQMEELQIQVRQGHEERELLLQASETFQSKLSDSESEISKLSKSLECALKEKNEIESKLNCTMGQAAEMQRAVADLNVLRESDGKEWQQMNEKCQASEQQVKVFFGKLESLERELKLSEDNREQITIQTMAYKEEVEILKAVKEDMFQKITNLGLELDGFRAKNEEVNKALQQARATVAELETSQSIMTGNLEKCELEKIKIETESISVIASLQSQLKNVNEELEHFRKEQETLKSKGDDMAGQLTCLQQDNKKLLEQLKEAECSNTHLQSSKDESAEKLVAFEENLNKKSQEIILLQKQIIDAEECKKNILLSVDGEQELWKQEKEGLQRLIDENEQKLRLVSAEKEALHNTIDVQKISLMNFEKEVSCSNSEKCSLVNQIAELTDDCTSLKNRLATVSERLEKIQEEFAVEKNMLVDQLRIITEKEESSKIQLDLVTSEKAELQASFSNSQIEQEQMIQKLKHEIVEYQGKLQKTDENQENLIGDLQKQRDIEIQSYKEKLALAEQSVSAQTLEIHILKSSKDDLNESLKQANKKLEEFNQTKVEKLKTTLAQMQKENKASRSKLELFTKSYKQLEQEKEKLQKYIAQQESTMKDLKEKNKQSDKMDAELKTLKLEIEELKEYAEEKSKEAEENIEKYCGLMINQHKLEEANELLQSRVDFLNAQLKQHHAQDPTSSVHAEKTCDTKVTKDQRLSKVQGPLAGKRPRTLESKDDDKEQKTNTPKNLTKRVKSKINSEAFHKTSGDNGGYELEGLPSVVQKGFADIPKGNLSPYIVRRTTLRSSPRLSAQKVSPVSPSLQKGICEGLPDIFKTTAVGSKSQKLNDAQKVPTTSTVGSVDSSCSPLSAHNKVEKTTPQSPRDKKIVQARRRSRSTRRSPQQPTEGENCKVQ
ncbi:centromere protein F isoform X2 [Ambystoma mexicanum]|uniref:centromere protein F isoform X2 n=1 Tax=Ambystoma mexicanum TaxID=8296 RepID=UPI0037E89824